MAQQHEDGWEKLIEVLGIALLIGLAAVVLLGIGLALPAELGARLAHGHWLPLGWLVLWNVGWDWLHHLSHPMWAWPALDRRALPNLVLYMVLLVLELALAIAVAVGLIALIVRLRHGGLGSRGYGRGARARSGGITRGAAKIPGKQHRGL